MKDFGENSPWRIQRWFGQGATLPFDKRLGQKMKSYTPNDSWWADYWHTFLHWNLSGFYSAQRIEVEKTWACLCNVFQLCPLYQSPILGPDWASLQMHEDGIRGRVKQLPPSEQLNLSFCCTAVWKFHLFWSWNCRVVILSLEYLAKLLTPYKDPPKPQLFLKEVSFTFAQ